MQNILIIYTGGTIGMVQNIQSGTLEPVDFAHINRHVPELQRLQYRTHCISFDPVIDSSDMQPAIWLKLADIIAKNYADYDGFVILHGSDTMAYTAAALSFLLINLSKPVILTGSQLPIGEIRTDARENLLTSIQIAAESNIPEVCIYFDYLLLRGNRAKKVHTSKFEAFHSPNYPPLAEAEINLRYYSQNSLPKPQAAFYHATTLETNISTLKVFPGISEEVVKAILNTNVRAVVMETFGSGNTTTQAWFTDLLSEAIANGKIIVDITQCLGGNVTLGKYATSNHLVSCGVISGNDLTFECAIAKLMYVLARYQNNADAIEAYLAPICGEMTCY